MSFYNLNDYKTATPIFRELVKHDNKNDRYKNWLDYSIHGQRIWLMRLIQIVSCILIVAEIFFGKLISSFALRMTLDGAGLIGLLFTLIYDYYIKYGVPTFEWTKKISN